MVRRIQGTNPSHTQPNHTNLIPKQLYYRGIEYIRGELWSVNVYFKTYGGRDRHK